MLDTSNNSRIYASEYGYDANNNINKIGIVAGNTGVSMTYTYGTDNLPSAYTAGANSGTYTYDELNRLKTKTSSITPTVSYNYKTGTSMVNQEYVGGATTSYIYDANGNITTLMTGGKAIFYQYDEFNRLVAELNKHTDQTTVYKYDAWGNIAMKWVYSGSNTWTPDSANLIKKYDYVYSSSTDMAWKDLMTEYDGQTITYDEIGNPTSYMGSTMYWEGRTLVEQVKNGTTITYSYDSSNMRTSKTVGGVKHNYYYVEGKLMYEDCPSYKLFYAYDANGFLSGIKRILANGTTENFGVHCNIFGDVISVYFEDGMLAATYTYDSWGKLLSVTDMAGCDVMGDNEIWTQNSIRYRGYVYDEETQLYYLQSRYYDPETCRFINADGYVATDSGITGYNMFTYCGNNPINRVDSTGMFWMEVGDFFSNAWNGFKTLVKDTFGAGTSTTATISKIETAIIPYPSPITVKTGNNTSQTIAKHGDSSKPISVYANKDAQHPIKSSSAGIKFNIFDFTLNLSVGFDNIGISGSLANSNTTNSFGVKLNLAEFKVGFEFATAIKWDDTTETTYTNSSISGWTILAAYGFSSSGQPVQSPQYAYSY